MTLGFVKWYNPAYDYFLTKYFQQKGLSFVEESSFQEANKKASEIRTRGPTSNEKLFLSYVGDWNSHPDSRPSLHYLLRLIYDDGKLTAERLEDLQSKLPLPRGRLILTQEEAALDFFNFYARRVKRPLATDVAHQVSVSKILDYFNSDDRIGLPYSEETDRREFEKAVRLKGEELISWLDRVNTETINQDMAHVIKQHREAGEHMQNFEKSPLVGLRSMRCEHHSNLVELYCSREPATSAEYILMQPARGYGVIEDGWKEVMFPRFNIFETTASRKQSIV